MKNWTFEKLKWLSWTGLFRISGSQDDYLNESTTLTLLDPKEICKLIIQMNGANDNDEN
jgi:hypothetical protein